MGELVRVESDQAIATIRLARPPMNALNGQLQAELADAAAQVSRDADVRAVIVYGGEKVFAAGADIKEMAQASYADMLIISRRLQDALAAVARIGKPVVAAITGYALGGGLELALCADFRVAGASAKLGQPEIQLGVIPGAGGTQRLPRLVGPARAKDTATSLVARYARGPALALRAAKRAIDDGLDTDLDTGLEIERLHFAGLFTTQDQRTGMRSFMENGPGKATFSGR